MIISRIISRTIPILLILTAAPSYGDGVFILYGNNGPYTKGRTAHNPHSYPAQRQIIGPVTSFSNSYGPVTSFGLRNYSTYGTTDLYTRRYSYDDNFNRYLRNKAVKEQRDQGNRMRFGYTFDKKAGNQGYKRGLSGSYGDSYRSAPKIIYYGD